MMPQHLQDTIQSTWPSTEQLAPPILSSLPQHCLQNPSHRLYVDKSQTLSVLCYSSFAPPPRQPSPLLPPAHLLRFSWSHSFPKSSLWLPAQLLPSTDLSAPGPHYPPRPVVLTLWADTRTTRPVGTDRGVGLNADSDSVDLE